MGLITPITPIAPIALKVLNALREFREFKEYVCQRTTKKLSGNENETREFFVSCQSSVDG